MPQQIVGIRAGSPDHAYPGRFKISSIRSDRAEHFTNELAQGESEQENISGLLGNRIIIQNISINAKQNLKFRLSFFASSTFTNTDLGQDTFIDSVIVDLSKYAATATFDL